MRNDFTSMSSGTQEAAFLTSVQSFEENMSNHE